MHIINPLEQLVHTAFYTFPLNIKATEIMFFEWIHIINHCYSRKFLLPGIVSDWCMEDIDETCCQKHHIVRRHIP